MIDVSGQSSNFSQIGFENRLRNKIIGSPPLYRTVIHKGESEKRSMARGAWVHELL